MAGVQTVKCLLSFVVVLLLVLQLVNCSTRVARDVTHDDDDGDSSSEAAFPRPSSAGHRQSTYVCLHRAGVRPSVRVLQGSPWSKLSHSAPGFFAPFPLIFFGSGSLVGRVPSASHRRAVPWVATICPDR